MNPEKSLYLAHTSTTQNRLKTIYIYFKERAFGQTSVLHLPVYIGYPSEH